MKKKKKMTWVVAKINKNQESVFKFSIKEKLKEEFEIFYPKIFKKNFKYTNLLGDYVFLKTNSNFTINKFKNLKGLKYYLNNFQCDQENIESFITNCKEHSENNILTLKFFTNLKLKKIKFKDGPFKNFLFDIFRKNKKIFAIYKNISINITEDNNKNFVFE